MKELIDADFGWMRDAACQKRRDLGWILDKPSLIWDGMREEATMAAICHLCPVFDECRQFVEAHEVTGGFWAGAWRSRDVEVPSTGDAA